jgi:hypothetical protein
LIKIDQAVAYLHMGEVVGYRAFFSNSTLGHLHSRRRVLDPEKFYFNRRGLAECACQGFISMTPRVEE